MKEISSLDELEKKYFSPIHILLVSTEDAGPLFILKKGRGAFEKVTNMHGDINMLIRELRKWAV